MYSVWIYSYLFKKEQDCLFFWILIKSFNNCNSIIKFGLLIERFLNSCFVDLKTNGVCKLQSFTKFWSH